mgnify:CR=1 FL=1
MKIRSVVATTYRDLAGSHFTREDLNSMAKTIVGKGVSWEFRHDVPGKVTRAWIDGNELHVEVEVGLDVYLVPMISGCDPVSATGVSLTISPAETQISPITVVPGGRHEQAR